VEVAWNNGQWTITDWAGTVTRGGRANAPLPDSILIRWRPGHPGAVLIDGVLAATLADAPQQNQGANVWAYGGPLKLNGWSLGDPHGGAEPLFWDGTAWRSLLVP
jgi:hypothetical protein